MLAPCLPEDQILQAAEFVTQRGALWRLAKDYKAQRHRDAPGSATDCGQRQLRDLREETEGVGGETRGATFPDSQAARRAPAALFWPQWVYRGYNRLGCKGLLHPLMWWGCHHPWDISARGHRVCLTCCSCAHSGGC